MRFVDQLSDNLARVRERMALAARRAGRKPEEIRLVVVTKGQPAEAVRIACELGVTDFGENRVEEALPKMRSLGLGPERAWHMIGHVQSRKAAEVAPSFALVHSVDSLKLARRLARFAWDAGRRLPVLVECNVTGEAAKQGYPAAAEAARDGLRSELQEMAALPSLAVRGLMTMAPYGAGERAVRDVFRQLRRLRDILTITAAGDLPELSMGMTDDFEIAIEEGATLIRVGRALFGERN